ncbi:MAG: hypothetical protein ACR2NX_00345 [Chthoniobacterales bacterium]
MQPQTKEVPWDKLAKTLGVSRRSLERWRAAFGRECPSDRDVVAWKRFMVLNGLKRADESLHPEELAAALREPRTLHPIRQALFDLVDFVHAQYADGFITLEQYSAIGAATVESVIALGAQLGAGIDETGFRQTWRAHLATAALRKNEGNKRSLS